MANPLLDRVLPQELAERGQVIVFKGNVGDFGRLAGIVASDLETIVAANRPRKWRDAPVETRLEFAWIDPTQALPAVEGRVGATVTAVCQRCLEAFEMPLETSFNMVFVDKDEDDEMMSQAECETWELEEETVRPLDIVEEVLIMALPLAPVHNSVRDCGPLAGSMPETRSDTVRPFADLRSQMERTDK